MALFCVLDGYVSFVVTLLQFFVAMHFVGWLCPSLVLPRLPRAAVYNVLSAAGWTGGQAGDGPCNLFSCIHP